MIQHGNLAGEWVIGGVEAKGFAFVLVFLGLEAFVRDRWQRAWLLLGAAAAFHVLVGGWAAVAVGIAWLLLGKDRPTLRSMWPSLGGGLLLSLPGLLPPLLLNWGTKALVVRMADEIYVYERLPHHLNPWKFPLEQLIPFALLCLIWLLVGRTAVQAESRRLRAFVVASLGIAVAGMVISLAGFWDRPLAASWLRFYWFRLADVAVPHGRGTAGRPLDHRNCPNFRVNGNGTVPFESPTTGGRKVHAIWLAIVVALAAFHLADCVVMRLFSLPPHADRLVDLDAWARGCRWLRILGKRRSSPDIPAPIDWPTTPRGARRAIGRRNPGTSRRRPPSSRRECRRRSSGMPGAARRARGRNSPRMPRASSSGGGECRRFMASPTRCRRTAGIIRWTSWGRADCGNWPPHIISIMF